MVITCDNYDCRHVFSIGDKDVAKYIKEYPFAKTAPLPKYNLTLVRRGRVKYVCCPECHAIKILGSEIDEEFFATPNPGKEIPKEDPVWARESPTYTAPAPYWPSDEAAPHCVCAHQSTTSFERRIANDFI